MPQHASCREVDRLARRMPIVATIPLYFHGTLGVEGYTGQRCLARYRPVLDRDPSTSTGCPPRPCAESRRLGLGWPARRTLARCTFTQSCGPRHSAPPGRGPDGVRRRQPRMVGAPADPAAGARHPARDHRPGGRPGHAVPLVLTWRPRSASARRSASRSARRTGRPVPEAAPPKLRDPKLEIVARGAIAARSRSRLWLLGRHDPRRSSWSWSRPLLTAASLLSPRFAAAIDRGRRLRAARGPGGGSPCCCSGRVQLLVFTPLWLLLRLLRARPARARRVAPTTRRSGGPVPRGPARALPAPVRLRAAAARRCKRRRPPAAAAPARGGRPGRAAGPARRRHRRRRSTGSRGGDSAQQRRAQAACAGQDVPAAAGEPWRVQLGAGDQPRLEHQALRPLPGLDDARLRGPVRERRATGCAAPTSRAATGTGRVDGLLLRRLDDVRRSTSATSTRSPPSSPGWPRRDGIPVRVVNYGRLAYVNWQETLLLEQLAIARRRLPTWRSSTTASTSSLGQFQLGPHAAADAPRGASRSTTRLGLGQRGRRVRGRRVAADAACRAWADVSVVHRLGERARARGRAPSEPGEPPVTASIWPGDQTDRPERRGALAASIYARGVDLARRLARSYGFADRLLLAAVPSTASRSCRARRSCAAGSAPTPTPGATADARGARAARPGRRRRQRRPRRRAQAGHVRLRAHQRAGRARDRPRRSTSGCGRSCCGSPRATAVNVLGISAFYHDSAAALVRDGELVAAAQEERFTRIKHDERFPINAIRYCLEAGGVGPGRHRRGRLLRQAAHHVRAAAAHLPARRPAGLRARSSRRCRCGCARSCGSPT